MRESKFRGRRVDNGEWVYGYLIEDQYIVGPIVEWTEDYFNTEYWFRVDPETVGQYTGLKDRNGKEIYEGDLLRVTHEDGDSEVYQVRYMGDNDYPAFDLVPHLDCDSNGLSHAMAVCEIEVIGNIYELVKIK